MLEYGRLSDPIGQTLEFIITGEGGHSPLNLDLTPGLPALRNIPTPESGGVKGFVTCSEIRITSSESIRSIKTRHFFLNQEFGRFVLTDTTYMAHVRIFKVLTPLYQSP